METLDIAGLKTQLKEYACRREWQKFHSPKNLAMALSVEAAELLEHFQWLTEEASYNLMPEKKTQISHEMADILVYLVRMADQLDINLIKAIEDKMLINEQRYPAEKVKGSAKKYTYYE